MSHTRASVDMHVTWARARAHPPKCGYAGGCLRFAVIKQRERELNSVDHSCASLEMVRVGLVRYKCTYLSSHTCTQRICMPL